MCSCVLACCQSEVNFLHSQTELLVSLVLVPLLLLRTHKCLAPKQPLLAGCSLTLVMSFWSQKRLKCFDELVVMVESIQSQLVKSP